MQHKVGDKVQGVSVSAGVKMWGEVLSVDALNKITKIKERYTGNIFTLDADTIDQVDDLFPGEKKKAPVQTTGNMLERIKAPLIGGAGE